MDHFDIIKSLNESVAAGSIRIIVLGHNLMTQTTVANSIGIGLKSKFRDLHIHDLKDLDIDLEEFDSEERDLNVFVKNEKISLLQARREFNAKNTRIDIFTFPAKPPKSPICDVIELVLDLARQNIIDEREDKFEHDKQVEACDQFEDFAANYLGDD